MSVKIAVVGTGGIAKGHYLPYLKEQEDVSLTYFSRTRTKAVDCAREFGGEVRDSVEALLADEPDAILVLTGERDRYDATLPLMEGKPKRIFFEKPLVARDGQANVCEDDFHAAHELLKRAKAAGTETAMVFNYRFFERTVRTLKLVEERGYGELREASLFVNYCCWSHCIDMLRLFGGPAVKISALSGLAEYGEGNQKATDVAAAFCLESGATGTILGTSGSSFDVPLFEFLLSFEGGLIRLLDLDGPMDVFDSSVEYDETFSLPGRLSRWDEYNASFGKSLAAYLESIRAGGPPPVPGLAGLEELQFEAALKRSITEGRPVNVQEEFPIDL